MQQKLILTDFFISGLNCVGIIFTYTDANYDFYIKMMYMSLNSKTTGVTSEVTTDITPRAHEFTPLFLVEFALFFHHLYL
jgi:hypothetical protein